MAKKVAKIKDIEVEVKTKKVTAKVKKDPKAIHSQRMISRNAN